MGLYKRCEHSKDEWARCDHAWWSRFKVCGVSKRQTTGTSDRRRAKAEERKLRAYLEAKAPRGQRQVGITIAYLGGLDYERAESDNVTAKRLRDIKKEWVRICQHFGADSAPGVITFESCTAFVNWRRASGVRGQSIIRDMQALKRGAAIAEELGALPFPPKMWPKVRRDPKKQAQRGKIHPARVLQAWFAELKGETYDEARLIALTGLRDEESAKATPSWREVVPEIGPFLRVPDWAAKDGDERFVFLGAEADAIFTRCSEGKAHDAPIFSGADHKKARIAACEAIGYPTNITLRDLRTTWSTLAAQGTGDAAAVQASMGHEDLRTTQMYQKSTLTRQAEAGRAVARELGSRWHSEGDTEPESGEKWSQEWELNPRPADYESAALPLSYLGPLS